MHKPHEVPTRKREITLNLSESLKKKKRVFKCRESAFLAIEEQRSIKGSETAQRIALKRKWLPQPQPGPG